METPECDLCGADDPEMVYAIGSWQPPAPDGMALARCKRCGLMYLRPRPGPAEIGAFYADDYAPFKRAVEDERWGVMRWMRRRKLADRRRMIERHSGLTAGRVLDVGCATGLFLHEMALAGWQADGVEPTPVAARYARERFGLPVFQGVLEDAPYPPASFDVATFWDVLEHTFSPARTLRRAAELLQPGGLLAINVPNWDSYEREWFGRYWIGLDPPRHLYVFTRATLTALLEQAGFRVLGWECFMPSYFSFIASAERQLQAVAPDRARPVMRLLNFPGVRLPFEPAFALANRMGRGGVIAVFARKETPDG